jgi:hypothetical protein
MDHLKLLKNLRRTVHCDQQSLLKLTAPPSPPPEAFAVDAGTPSGFSTFFFFIIHAHPTPNAAVICRRCFFPLRRRQSCVVRTEPAAVAVSAGALADMDKNKRLLLPTPKAQITAAKTWRTSSVLPNADISHRRPSTGASLLLFLLPWVLPSAISERRDHHSSCGAIGAPACSFA